MPTTIDSLTLSHYLFTGAMLFCLGLIGFVTRRNLIIMFLCTEMMFQGVVISLVAFSRFNADVAGMVLTVFAICLTVAEISIGLALVILLFRARRTALADHIDWLKG